MTVQVIEHHGAPAVLVNVDTPGVRAASRAIEKGFGRAPVFMREGGSIPVVGLLKDHLGVDTLLLGWGQNDDNLHGPNEKFHLADFHRGIKASPICSTNCPAKRRKASHVGRENHAIFARQNQSA